MEGLDSGEKMGLLKLHVALGLIVFLLTLVRTWLFFKSPRPADLATGSKFNDKLAVWVHNAFYFLLIGITLSGIATMILGGYGEALKTGNPKLILGHEEIPPLKGHGIMALLLMVLFVVHVVGVIKHYIITKENTLKRITNL